MNHRLDDREIKIDGHLIYIYIYIHDGHNLQTNTIGFMQANEKINQKCLSEMQYDVIKLRMDYLKNRLCLYKLRSIKLEMSEQTTI